MRRFVAPILCAFVMAGVAGCADHPPPPAKVAKVKKARKSKKPPQATFEFVDNTLKLPGPVVFKTGSAELDPISDEVLQIVADYLEAKPEISALRIEGHTDADGAAPANLALSMKRAMAVSYWLTAEGIDCHRLVVVGFGQTKPVAPNDTAEHKAQNRRVAFINAAVNGRVIENRTLDGGGTIAGDACH